ncbi:MAG TPA: hypothetical protein VJ915_05085 [Balneolaceae bacterium]|nr:hypothetical protein [Balneolaceae bacterium]
MSEFTLIIHGWSDCSSSFVALKNQLQKQGVGDVDTILYGDYQSREDNITFNDVIDGLNDQMIEKGLIEPDGKKRSDLNIVVHSTGGLVIRHWIYNYYADRIDECPVKRILMLAPANFGSPLAHRGKSFLGRLVKGRWKVGDLLEVGRNLLDGLELGSPYQWSLAHYDIFTSETPYYNRNQIQLTILTGIEDYEGLKGWVNKPGTDGTIVIAGATLNSVKLSLNFSNHDVPYQWKQVKTADDFCFGVLPGLDHGTIVSSFKEDDADIVDLAVEALTIKTPDDFADFKARLRASTEETYESYQSQNSTRYSKFQQFIIHGIDDHGEPIRDFTFEFDVYKTKKAENNTVSSKSYFNNLERKFSDKFQEILLGQIHTHNADSSYRRLLVNLNKLQALMEETKQKLGDFVLVMKIYIPEIDKGIYYDVDSLQNIVIYRSNTGKMDENAPSLFYANTTTLLEFSVDRKTKYVRIGTEPA